ncbi:hypothetical protein SLE2022_090300 [Rubroshorea leprosula]
MLLLWTKALEPGVEETGDVAGGVKPISVEGGIGGEAIDVEGAVGAAEGLGMSGVCDGVEATELGAVEGGVEIVGEGEETGVTAEGGVAEVFGGTETLGGIDSGGEADGP